MSGDAAAVPAGRVAAPGLGAGLVATLAALALMGWWWSARMVDEMGAVMVSPGPGAPGMMDSAVGSSMSFASFALAWVAMMTAMMFPAISPVVRLYALAAARGRVAPLPFFVGAYLAVWAALALPAYLVWRSLQDPIADGADWAARLAAAVLLVAAAWQLSPLKSTCLRHCRSPLSFFMEHGGSATRRRGAFRMGASHGLFCLGCCWALMAVLVAMGTMNLGWMLALSAVIFLEKNARFGERVAVAASAMLLIAGVALIFDPDLLTALT